MGPIYRQLEFGRKNKERERERKREGLLCFEKINLIISSKIESASEEKNIRAMANTRRAVWLLGSNIFDFLVFFPFTTHSADTMFNILSTNLYLWAQSRLRLCNTPSAIYVVLSIYYCTAAYTSKRPTKTSFRPKSYFRSILVGGDS